MWCDWSNSTAVSRQACISLRVLKGRSNLAMNTLTGETPEDVVRGVGEAQAADPSLNMSGIHFFTFGSLAKSANWAKQFQA